MLRKRAAVGALIAAAAVCGTGTPSSGAIIFSLLAAGGESAALGAAAPPASLLASRDRSATEPLRRRPKSCWWEETMDPEHTDDDEFKQQVRLPRCVFFKVLEDIEQHDVFRKPANVGERGVGVDKQLMAFLLRVGANLLVHTVRKKLGISENTVAVSVRRVAEAIGDNLGYKMRMPKNGTAAKEKVKRMFARRDPAFENAVGIVDCTHVQIVCPTEAKSSGNTAVFLDRRGHVGLSFQAITTPERTPRFLNLSGGVPGSAYDTRLLQRSAVFQNLQEYLEGEEFLCGDCGYALRPWMMRGWAESELKAGAASTRDRRAFNRLYSGMRISVERAFGILKARFRSLGAKLHLRREEDYRSVVQACCILHNICAEFSAAVRYICVFSWCFLFLTPSPFPPFFSLRHCRAKRLSLLPKRSTTTPTRSAPVRGRSGRMLTRLGWEILQQGGARGIKLCCACWAKIIFSKI